MPSPRAYWKGTLKLSLVSCPVELYPASTSVEKTHFHLINAETGNRLKQQMVDEETGEVVDKDAEEPRLRAQQGQISSRSRRTSWTRCRSRAPTPSRSTVSCRATRSTAAISTIPITSPPTARPALDAFAVIRDAMNDQDRVALARIVLTNREHVIAIEPFGKGLLGTTLRYPYELRDDDDYFAGIKSPKISKDMIELAVAHSRQQGGAFRSVQLQGRVRDRAENAGEAQGRRQTAAEAGSRGKARQRRQPDGRAEAELERQTSRQGRSTSADQAKYQRAQDDPRPGATAQGRVSGGRPIHCRIGRARSTDRVRSRAHTTRSTSS